jgi:hypothetical protein
VDSRDSGAIEAMIQGCLWRGGSGGSIGSAGPERRTEGVEGVRWIVRTGELWRDLPYTRALKV